ncbi:unnamed protein product [Chrysoparadoxa australica]
MRGVIACAAALLCCSTPASSFLASPPIQGTQSRPPCRSRQHSLPPPLGIRALKSKTRLESNAMPLTFKPGPHLKVGGNILNLFGVVGLPTKSFLVTMHVAMLAATCTPTASTHHMHAFFSQLYLINVWLFGIFLFPFLLATTLVSRIVEPKRLRAPTFIGVLWCRITCILMGMRPRVTGKENLPPSSESVVFVANHSSFMDIPMSGFLPRLVKYLSKAELCALPIVGWKTVLAGDIIVYRQRPETFRKLLETTANSLRNGNSIMVFPEGTRSKDGTLGNFKKGPVLMAQRAGVKLVPVTITGVAELMPPKTLAPVRPGKGLSLEIHKPVDPKGRPPEEVANECREIIRRSLPEWQRGDGTPVENKEEGTTSTKREIKD